MVLYDKRKGLQCAVNATPNATTVYKPAQADLDGTMGWCRKEGCLWIADEEVLAVWSTEVAKGDDKTYAINILISKSRDHISCHRD